MGKTLGHFVRQTWRSIVSFFMSFVVLGLMVWFTPDLVSWFMDTVGQFKSFVGQAADSILPSQVSAVFKILVPDTAIAFAGFTLFTRVVVLTLILWLGSVLLGINRGGES